MDAYSESKKEVIEVCGCFWHGHDCNLFKKRSNEQIERYQRTLERAEFIEEVTGLKVKLVWECEINYGYNGIQDCRPPVYRQYKMGGGHFGRNVTKDDILRLTSSGEFFGVVEVDIEVPPHLTEKFSEFAPLFVTCEIPITSEEIGECMMKHIEEHHLSLKPRKQLVAGLKARQILLAIPLLRWYLSKGLVVTKVYQAVEWNSQPCLKEFFDGVAQD